MTSDLQALRLGLGCRGFVCTQLGAFHELVLCLNYPRDGLNIAFDLLRQYVGQSVTVARLWQ